ncbi:MAG: hypothetical protein LBB62_04380 [Proteiniphilum sp.]|jgi:hypothetical protein|nr:hypothetical protein [Proteiniphilum sp.]
MKRVIYFLMALAFTAGCSQYEYKLSDSGLTVTESLLEFTAKGGDGYILVESGNSIKAESNSNWCQIKVSGKKIEVTVAPYDGIENRTAVVSITAGEDYPVNVPVTQFASRFIIDDLAFDIDFLASSMKTAAISDNAITVSTVNTWIDARYERDSVFITVERNNNPAARTGKVEVTSNNITQSIVINQAGRSLAFEDVLGNYEMSYQSTPTSAVSKRNVSFVRSATTGYYDVTGLPLGILKVKFNSTNKTLEIYAGQNMGVDSRDPSRVIVPLVYDTAQGYISWSESYFYKGVWNNAFDAGMAFTFEDSGSWAGYIINALYFVSSNQYPVANGSYTGAFIYINISLKKLNN